MQQAEQWHQEDIQQLYETTIIVEGKSGKENSLEREGKKILHFRFKPFFQCTGRHIVLLFQHINASYPLILFSPGLNLSRIFLQPFWGKTAANNVGFASHLLPTGFWQYFIPDILIFTYMGNSMRMCVVHLQRCSFPLAVQLTLGSVATETEGEHDNKCFSNTCSSPLHPRITHFTKYASDLFLQQNYCEFRPFSCESPHILNVSPVKILGD